MCIMISVTFGCWNIERFVKVYLAMCWFYYFENGYIKFYDSGIFLWILIYFYICNVRPKCWRLHKSFGQATIFLMIIIPFILFYFILFCLDAVYVLCYSLILLSIDLTSPHVKNKMSKREFIRNTRRAAQNISEDFVGHLYDNIYLIGHVAA